MTVRGAGNGAPAFQRLADIDFGRTIDYTPIPLARLRIQSCKATIRPDETLEDQA